MSQESLRELLARVHERLSQTSAFDSESRGMLKTVMRDIERALEGNPAADGGGHTARLESLAVHFEAEHPQLADTLRQLIDSLGKAGI
jgi:hypothetical protein